MSANAVDERLFFGAKVGRTIRMGVDGTPRKLGDDLAPLPPGKYFIQLVGAITAQVKTGDSTLEDAVDNLPHPTGGTQDIVNEFFLDPTGGVKSFIIHVRNSEQEGHIYAIASGDGTLLITKTGE